jgi:hypothetical protein
MSWEMVDGGFVSGTRRYWEHAGPTIFLKIHASLVTIATR